MTNTQTSASGMSLLPEGTGMFTTLHLALIAVLAVLVILGILWGIRLKRVRRQAARDVIEHAREAGVPPVGPAEAAAPPVTPSPSQAPAQTQVQAPPVAPAPAPVADTPVMETPEPIADARIAATFEGSSATETAPPAPHVADHAGEPVTLLKGLGPKVAGRLAELGVTTVGQMAALSDDQAESIDAQLGAFTGRMGRDRWIEQARFLAAGDRAGFEAVFGKL
jgi:predicted flap endonuclease-1-like 5' DNA nuclease